MGVDSGSAEATAKAEALDAAVATGSPDRGADAATAKAEASDGAVATD